MAEMTLQISSFTSVTNRTKKRPQRGPPYRVLNRATNSRLSGADFIFCRPSGGWFCEKHTVHPEKRLLRFSRRQIRNVQSFKDSSVIYQNVCTDVISFQCQAGKTCVGVSKSLVLVDTEGYPCCSCIAEGSMNYFCNTKNACTFCLGPEAGSIEKSSPAPPTPRGLGGRVVAGGDQGVSIWGFCWPILPCMFIM